MKEIGRYEKVVFIQDPSMGNQTFWGGGDINAYFTFVGGRRLRNIKGTTKYGNVSNTQVVNGPQILVPTDIKPYEITWIVSGDNDMANFMKAYFDLTILAETNE